jgi:peptidoglycan hydrolase CwlO-like protein
MKTKFQINQQTLFYILVLLLLGYLIFSNTGIKTNVKDYKDKIESIQTKVDSVNTVNKQLDEKISNVDTQVLSITKEIHQVDKTITIIKKQTDEKVNSVDNYTHNELEQFFTNRYK